MSEPAPPNPSDLRSELGHAIFRPFGTYIMAAGGTIAQLAAPIVSLFIFRWQRDFFGLSVGICWLATNLWGISVYLGDARAQKLPLVAPGMGLIPGGDTSGMGGIIHDWKSNWCSDREFARYLGEDIRIRFGEPIRVADLNLDQEGIFLSRSILETIHGLAQEDRAEQGLEEKVA